MKNKILVLSSFIIFSLILWMNFTFWESVKQKSTPYENISNCEESKKSNNEKYSDYIRSSCFKEWDKYIYYICDKTEQTCSTSNNTSWSINDSWKTSSWDINLTLLEWKNPYSYEIDVAVLKKLNTLVTELKKVKDIKVLKDFKSKLDILYKKFYEKPAVVNIIKYLSYEVDIIIKDFEKNDWIDDFFCELSGNCNQKPICPEAMPIAKKDWCEIITKKDSKWCISFEYSCKPVCPEVKLANPPVWCKYTKITNSTWCIDYKLVCEEISNKDYVYKLATNLQKQVCNNSSSTITWTGTVKNVNNVNFCWDYISVDYKSDYGRQLFLKTDFSKNPIWCNTSNNSQRQNPKECNISCTKSDYLLCEK